MKLFHQSRYKDSVRLKLVDQSFSEASATWRSRQSILVASIIPLFVCLGILMSACGADDVGDGVAAVDEPVVGTGSEELVRVPDVVGLSSDEAYARLEAAGFVYFPALREVSEPGVEDDTVGAVFPAPQTMRPLGSLVVLDIYSINLEQSLGADHLLATLVTAEDWDRVTAEDWDRARIQAQISTEFGDRVAQDYWDKTTATFHFQIVDLSTEDIDRLHERYANETFKVTFSPEAVSSGCKNYPSTTRIARYSLNRVFLLPPDAPEFYPSNNCLEHTKHDVLSFVADFAREHTTPVYPAMLVQLVEFVLGDYSTILPATPPSR